MISRLLVSLLLIPLVFSEPDLCRNPKLDSISYIPDKKMWFFTSVGYYWLINETEFPPGPPNGKLPDPFKKGDASFYMDYKTACSQKGSSSKGVRTDQVVVVVEKVDAGNRLIELDTNTNEWSKSEEWSANKIVGRTKIQNPNQEIDAIFTMGDEKDSKIHDRIFVIQKEKYAVVSWIRYCSSKDVIAFSSLGMDKLFGQNKIFNAMTFKEKLYVFLDPFFWTYKISHKESGYGYIMVENQGISRNASTEFFKFPAKCPEIIVTTSPKQTNESENGVTSPTIVESNEGNPSVSELCGGRPPFLIVIMVVIFMIVESTNRSL